MGTLRPVGLAMYTFAHFFYGWVSEGLKWCAPRARAQALVRTTFPLRIEDLSTALGSGRA